MGMANELQCKHKELYEITKNIVDRLMALRMAITLTMTYVEDVYKKHSEKMDTFAISVGVKQKNGDIRIPGDRIFEFMEYERNHRVLSQSIDILPNSYFVAIISQFDAFMGHMLRYYYRCFPGALDNSERQFKYSELASFSSIEEVYSTLVSDEIESVLRRSHTDQFKYLEGKFKVELRKELPCWPDFVEVTQRRNLFVHCDGIVSKQYLSICADNCVQLEKDIKVSKKLTVTPEYYIKATDVIFEIAVKLSQVIWRKVFNNDGGGADKSLIDISFEALCHGDYEAVKRLSLFCSNHIGGRFESEENRLIMLVNCAIANKLAGDAEECERILRSVDWSSRSAKFKLATSILKDDYDDAVSYMHIIGSRGEMSKEAYCTWPLFLRIREDERFKKAYEEIFGEPYAARVSAGGGNENSTVGECKEKEVTSPRQSPRKDKSGKKKKKR